MGRFDGLKGLVLGVANDHSIAWAIAKEILAGQPAASVARSRSSRSSVRSASNASSQSRQAPACIAPRNETIRLPAEMPLVIEPPPSGSLAGATLLTVGTPK